MELQQPLVCSNQFYALLRLWRAMELLNIFSRITRCIKRYAGGKRMNGNVISVGKHRHKKCGKDVISVNIVAIVLVGFCIVVFDSILFNYCSFVYR